MPLFVLSSLCNQYQKQTIKQFKRSRDKEGRTCVLPYGRVAFRINIYDTTLWEPVEALIGEQSTCGVLRTPGSACSFL